MRLLPAIPPVGNVNVRLFVFDEPHPVGAVPEPNVKVRLREDKVCVGSAAVIAHESRRTMTLALPVDTTVIGARPFTEGMTAVPPFVSQNTNMAV